jgi:hypothetical protein
LVELRSGKTKPSAELIGLKLGQYFVNKRCLVDLKSLKYFVDAGSIKTVFCCPAFYHHSINKLEAEFDTVLLIRHKKAVTATSAGQQFYQHSRALLNQAESMHGYFNPLKSQ